MKENNEATYNGNPLLKRIGESREWSGEEVEEYLKCKNDVLYFVRTYVKIVHVDRGLIQYDPYDFQEELIDTLHTNRFVISKCPRQVGKSTTVTAYLLHYAIFNREKTIGILANKHATAVEILGKISKAYENLPKFLQQGIVSWNKAFIQLENGSRIISAATSSSSIRGYSFSCVFIDECAHIESNTWDEFYKSTYPTISSGKDTKLILISTPKGLNHFHKLWVDAEEKRNKFITHSVHWSSVPGRDDEWRKETISNTSAQDFAQEHECVSGDCLVEVRDTSTGKVQRIPIKNLYENS